MVDLDNLFGYKQSILTFYNENGRCEVGYICCCGHGKIKRSINADDHYVWTDAFLHMIKAWLLMFSKQPVLKQAFQAKPEASRMKQEVQTMNKLRNLLER